MDESHSWETYEEVATYLLNQFATKFGIERFEGKQNVEGKRSGTSYEIDAKGMGSDNEVFIIVECRRYTTSRQSQERLGGLAYRIIDTEASGGILVSPMGLQEGAKKNSGSGKYSWGASDWRQYLCFVCIEVLGSGNQGNPSDSKNFSSRYCGVNREASW
jgi:hypothetical protein